MRREGTLASEVALGIIILIHTQFMRQVLL